MRVSLIRHGITEANERRLYCGHTDIPLSAEGRRRLKTLKEAAEYPAADMYISSGLARADETLRILYCRDQDVTIEEFKEMNFGEFEMRSYDDLKARRDYQSWISGDGCISCPLGESRNVFHGRVSGGIDRLTFLKAESFVIVSHGGVIASIMERFFPGLRSFYEWQPDFGRGYTFDILNGGAELISKI